MSHIIVTNHSLPKNRTQEEKPPKRAFVSFFGKGSVPSIHPSDVETGGGYERRKFRFSHAPERKDSSMVG